MAPIDFISFLESVYYNIYSICCLWHAKNCFIPGEKARKSSAIQWNSKSRSFTCDFHQQ